MSDLIDEIWEHIYKAMMFMKRFFVAVATKAKNWWNNTETETSKRKKKKQKQKEKEIEEDIDEIIREFTEMDAIKFQTVGTEERIKVELHTMRQIKKNHVLFRLSNVVPYVPKIIMWDAQDSPMLTRVNNKEECGLISNARVGKYRVSATSSHVLSLMESLQRTYYQVNPQVYADSVCERLMKVSPSAVKRDDECYMFIMREEDSVPVLIQTLVYDVYRYTHTAADGRKKVFYPIAIGVIIQDAEKYILSGGVIVVNKSIPYIISCSIELTGDEQVTVLIANILQPHKCEVEFTIFKA